MKINRLPNGNLEMSLNFAERAYWAEQKDSSDYESELENAFIEELSGEGFYRAWPEDFGCLTDAPMIQNSDGEVWGYMNYAVRSFMEELINGESVVWQRGE